MANTNEEIDLFYLGKIFTKSLKSILRLGFKVLNFIKKSWIILLILILAGVGYGFYIVQSAGLGKQAKILVRINFDSVNYVYSKVNYLNEKLAEKKEGVIPDENIPKPLAKLTQITIEPIINLTDIIEDQKPNDPNVEGLLRYMEFDFDDNEEITTIADTFTSEYNYHYIQIYTSSYAKDQVIAELMAFLNDNDDLQHYKDVYLETLSEAIENNKKTVAQIDALVAANNQDEFNPSKLGDIYFIDKNLNIAQVLTNKMELEKEIETNKRKLAYSKDIVVNINKPTLYVGEKSLMSNKMIFYPLLLVFVYLLLAGIWGTFVSLKKYAEN
ncbi:MAG TPA: hypothetical protein PKW08_00700 [Flavobacteriaceae bacterium]|nr:hypothetical protein [Flavobacteriaceae bacterium]MCB9211923.1 hypothetical protein [Alteromonas sp.]HPF09983.1 hypothetical protein [Flavobacteriaceae bacterium]HQU20080.1 hypothetical protein [Flavobacteriaceae bacterium]HQU63934.1 hypothetical protein [Flavobacteriaceae bacterium]